MPHPLHPTIHTEVTNLIHNSEVDTCLWLDRFETDCACISCRRIATQQAERKGYRVVAGGVY